MPAIFSRCWSKYPALLYGLSAFISASLAIFDISWLTAIFLFMCFILPIFIPPITLASLSRILLAVILGFAAFIFTTCRYQIPLTDTSLIGQAHVNFSSITHSKTAFGSVWTYRGTLHSLITDEDNGSPSKEVAKNLPVTLSLPSKSNTQRPSTIHHYMLPGQLKETDQGRYTLSLNRGAEWKILTTKQWRLSEWRFNAKNFTRKFIYSYIKDVHAAAFLAGIATGEFDDRQLSFELGRFGLQHLMAVSGLHFAVLASIIGFLLHLIFPYRLSAYLLLILLSSYFLFLGPSPSVIRAWVTITIALMGTILAKRSVALNSLGVALFVMAFIDPFALINIGFQFSFAVTAAILVWFAPCEQLCQKLFAKRALSEIAEMGSLSQHGYCLLYFLRQALALALAVNLVALPMTLYHFHKFPMTSLIYNLFFPFLMSLAMLLLFIGLLFSLIFPWLADHAHALIESFTQFVLSFAFNLPTSFDIAIRMDNLPKEGLIIYLIIIFSLGLYIKISTKTDSQSEGLIFV